MNLNQLSHTNSNYQNSMIVSNGPSIINEVSPSTELVSYNYNTQLNDTSSSYVLNVNQSNINKNIYEKSSCYSIDDLNSNVCKKDKNILSPQYNKNVHLRDNDETNESNINYEETNHELKKRKKFKIDTCLVNNESNLFLYHNNHLNSGYYPSRSSIATLSSNSSPISSSSTSPLYNQNNGSNIKSIFQGNPSNTSCLNSLNTNNRNNIFHSNYNESVSNSYTYTFQNNHSKLTNLDEMNIGYSNDQNKAEGYQDNQDSEYTSNKMKKNKKDPITEYDSELAESIEYELGLKKQNGPRKNSWGNLSYAELISRAIESSTEQRLTLSQIYDWIIKYVPYFKEKFDRTSSAGWKVFFYS